MILSRWGLHRFPHDAQISYKWLAWLWRHWDPDKEKRPVCPSTIREPILAGWMVHHLDHPLNLSDQSFHRVQRNAWVTMTLFPGVSLAQAKKAFEMTFRIAQESITGKTMPNPAADVQEAPNRKLMHSLLFLSKLVFRRRP